MRTGIMNNIYNNRSRKSKCRENKCLINDILDYVFDDILRWWEQKSLPHNICNVYPPPTPAFSLRSDRTCLGVNNHFSFFNSNTTMIFTPEYFESFHFCCKIFSHNIYIFTSSILMLFHFILQNCFTFFSQCFPFF